MTSRPPLRDRFKTWIEGWRIELEDEHDAEWIAAAYQRTGIARSLIAQYAPDLSEEVDLMFNTARARIERKAG